MTMMRKKKITKFLQANWPILLGILGAVLYVYRDMIFGIYRLSYSNLVYRMMPWKSLEVATKGPILSDTMDNLIQTIFSTMRSGEPYQFWNNMIGLGAKEDISIIMYPLYLLYLLPLSIATFVKSVFQFIVAFFAMYRLVREFGCRKLPSVISGILYTFCSSLVCWHSWPHSDVAMFAPFAFLLVWRLVRERKITDTIWLTIVLYLMLIAGMPTFAAYFLYLLGVWIVILTIYRYRMNIRKILIVFFEFGSSVVMAGLISFPYTAQLLLSVGSNGYTDSRKNQGFDTLETFYLSLSYYPDWTQELARHFNECTFYIGMLGLILLLCTFIRLHKRKNIWYWAGAAVVLLLFIYTHTLDFIYTRLPAINTSNKFRVMVLLNFTIAILSGFHLDDLIENREYYKKRWYLMLPAVLIVLGGWIYFSELELGALSETLTDTKIITLCYILASALCLILYAKWGRKEILVILCIVTVLDLGGFASSYLPFIEKGAKDIPDPTDSIAYLQEHTKNGERITAVDTWTLFPNMNVFYGLKDSRSHNLINTNPDLTLYFTLMDEWYYTTPTRTAVWKIQNYNLLKYLGVKYIADTQKYNLVSYVENRDGQTSVGDLHSGKYVRQTFTVNQDEFTSIQIQAATFGNTYKSEEELRVRLLEKESRKLICEKGYPLSTLKDNAYLLLEFETIKDSKGKTYELYIYNSAHDESLPVTVWRSGSDAYEGELIVNGQRVDADLILMVGFTSENWTPVYDGADGLFIKQVDEWTERFTLCDTAFIGDSEKTTIAWMAEEFLPNTVFISTDYYSESITEAQLWERLKKIESTNPLNAPYGRIDFQKLTDLDQVTLLSETDDCTKLEVSLSEGRFLLFNEYYDDEWSVYIDGEKAELLKANFLMRAVYLPESGTHQVEFRYEPRSTWKLIAVAVCGGLLLGGVIVFRKKIQRAIDAY